MLDELHLGGAVVAEGVVQLRQERLPAISVSISDVITVDEKRSSTKGTVPALASFFNIVDKPGMLENRIADQGFHNGASLAYEGLRACAGRR